ncbi:MAG: alpha/beta fold hydrolase [Candidatus Hermodarchaeota archaeon]
MPYAEVNNAKIYYEVGGSGEPLLLIHGVRGSIRNWEYVRPIITKHFQTIFADLRGHGQSSELTEITKVETFAQDHIELLKHLEIDQCHVAGHSLGGFIAQQIALDAPSQLKSLILIDTAPTTDVEGAQAQIKLGQLAYGLSPEEAVEKSLEFAYYDPKKIRETPGMMGLLVFLQHDAQRLANSHGYAMGAAASFNIQNRVKEINLPTLVIIAAQDETFPVKWGEFYKKQLSNVNVQIIEESNHGIQFEQPKALVQAIVDFVKTL